MATVPPRRWSKRTLVLTVLGLVMATAVLTVGMVGFARSIGFVTSIGEASAVLNDVAQISPEVTSGGSPTATPGANAAGGVEAIPAAPASAPVTLLTEPPAMGGSAARMEAEIAVAPAEVEAVAGRGGVAGSGGVGGSGGVAGAAPTEAVAADAAGAGGAAPTGWDGYLQSMLRLVEQNTTQMCGRNTCNIGQVCCNFSCGTCVAPGASCDQAECSGAARVPTAVRCGSGQCNDGQVCCNQSCGICAAPGETCSTQTCP
jgi:hypothetical protein